jgi:hypothetical protein
MFYDLDNAMPFFGSEWVSIVLSSGAEGGLCLCANVNDGSALGIIVDPADLV